MGADILSGDDILRGARDFSLVVEKAPEGVGLVDADVRAWVNDSLHRALPQVSVLTDDEQSERFRAAPAAATIQQYLRQADNLFRYIHVRITYDASAGSNGSAMYFAEVTFNRFGYFANGAGSATVWTTGWYGLLAGSEGTRDAIKAAVERCVSDFATAWRAANKVAAPATSRP